MSTGIPYLGSKISLISKSEIRYEGILYTIDTKESTVALAKVRSYGTEDRPTDRPVAPRDETYEYIIFRGADIKDIRVCQPPKPQPTLEGGLPNDPAIVQHSGGPPLFGAPGQTGAPGTAPFSQSNKTPTAGANNYGPIGSSAPGGGQPFSAAPGSTVNNQKRRKRTRRMSGQRSYRKRSGKSTNGSPVMDMLRDGNRSGQSSPAQGHREKRPSSRSSAGAQNGRGGPTRGRGMFRGRGYRGGGMPNQNFRGGAPGIRGGFQPGRPHANKKESLKFEKDYDFEEANQEFAEVLSKLQKSTLEDDSTAEKDDHVNEHHSDEEGEIVDEAGERKTPSTDAHQSNASTDEQTPVYYDKAKSFFDTISCEAVERSKGKVNKPDWKAEKKLNRETFGVAGNVGRRNYFPSDRGNMRGRGGYSGGYNNYRGGGYGGQGGGYYRGGYGGQGGGYGFNNGYNNGGYRGRGRGMNNNQNFGGRGGRGMNRGRGWGDARA